MGTLGRGLFALVMGCTVAGIEVQAQDTSSDSEAMKALKEQEALYKQQEAVLKAEQAAYETQAARDKAKYGDPVTGKTGKITEEKAFGELAKQSARRLAPPLAKRVGNDINRQVTYVSCPALLLTADPKIGAKTRRVQTLRGELRILKDELDALEKRLAGVKAGKAYGQAVRGLTNDKSVDFGFRTLSDGTTGIKHKADAFLGTLNSIVGIVGAFQADYEAKAHEVEIAPEWYLPGVARPLIEAKIDVISDVFPSTSSASSIADEFSDVARSAESLQAALSDVTDKSDKRLRDIKKQADAIAVSIAAAKTKLYTADQSGVAPMETLAQISSVADKSLCTTIVQSSVSAIQLTKETIFGKGGKMYLSFSIQLYWSLFDQHGKALALGESACERVAVLDLGSMTKPAKQGASLNAMVLEPARAADACTPEVGKNSNQLSPQAWPNPAKKTANIGG